MKCFSVFFCLAAFAVISNFEAQADEAAASAIVLCQQEDGTQQDDSQAQTDRSPVSGDAPQSPDGVSFLDDAAIRKEAERQVNRLIQSKQAISCRELARQVDRQTCSVEWVKRKRRKLSSPKLYAEATRSIVAILISRQHGDHWHIVPSATGFIVAPGVIATNRHVFEAKDEFMFALTADMQVHPIQEVLATNQDNDAALCRIDDNDYPALPLRADAPVGAAVRLISHPRGRFFTLSEGLVSRRYVRPPKRSPRSNGKQESGGNDENGEDKAETENGEGTNEDAGSSVPRQQATNTRWITVTADFGLGSSGAPVFDRFGNVIAMSTSTQIVSVGERPNRLSQVVFRDCVPAEVLRDLVESPQEP
jgi:S1-C subfamily serine protease